MGLTKARVLHKVATPINPSNVGALVTRIGFWGLLIYNYSIISPKTLV